MMSPKGKQGKHSSRLYGTTSTAQAREARMSVENKSANPAPASSSSAAGMRVGSPVSSGPEAGGGLDLDELMRQLDQLMGAYGRETGPEAALTTNRQSTVLQAPFLDEYRGESGASAVARPSIRVPEVSRGNGW